MKQIDRSGTWYSNNAKCSRIFLYRLFHTCISPKSLILTTDDLEFIGNIRGVHWAIGMLMKSGQSKFKDEGKCKILLREMI